MEVFQVIRRSVFTSSSLSKSSKCEGQVVDVLVEVQHQVPMFIDDVAQETEKNRDEDGADKAKIDAKNHLKNYCVARETPTRR